MRRPGPRRTIPLTLLLMLVSVPACDGGAAVGSGQRPAPSHAIASPPRGNSVSPAARITLPTDFPVLPGARSETPPDDPWTIAVWTSAEVGPVAYDHYLAALPAAGYPILGRYPGGEVAVIRFDTRGNGTWQLVLTRNGDGTRIELRLDQP